MDGLRKAFALFVGLLVFELAFFLLGQGLRPLRDMVSDPVWWTLRVVGIGVGLFAALFAGSFFWRKRGSPRVPRRKDR